MSEQSSAVPEFAAASPVVVQAPRPMYWSVRRELWENRSIYVAPLLVAAVVMFGFVLSTIGMPHRRRATLLLAPAQQHTTIAMPFDIAAAMLVVTAFVIGIFYCLDALQGERRDRSILFWKSLPVSDRTTVLAKTSIPLLALPAFTFVIIVLTQWFMLLWSTAVLLPSGLAGSTWMHFHWFTQSLLVFYCLIVLVLWHAPIYALLLLISSWARRGSYLWAVLPPLAIAAVEKIVFNTAYFGSFLKYRLIGGIGEAFVFKAPHGTDSLSRLTPLNFLSTPGLWLGLILAAIFITAAVRLRRDREPV
ncbi:MAG TPA: ABC transporter permease [Thermoanaerobaculia bacterium]|nr:ABC transporter permease [Thermoanaerobaculia bacterium]